MKLKQSSKRLQLEILVTGAAIILLFAIALSGIAYKLWMLTNDLLDGQFARSFHHTIFLLVMMLLSYGVHTYLFERMGYLKRVLTSTYPKAT